MKYVFYTVDIYDKEKKFLNTVVVPSKRYATQNKIMSDSGYDYIFTKHVLDTQKIEDNELRRVIDFACSRTYKETTNDN